MKYYLSRPICLFISGLFIMNSPKAQAHEDNQTLNKGVPKISIIENKGQWTKEAKFKAIVPSGVVFLTNQGFVYNYYDQKHLDQIHDNECGPKAIPGYNSDGEMINMHSYRVNFLGSNASTIFEAQDKQKTYHNYYIGKDASKWATNVGIYQTILQKEVYSGVDLKVYTDKEGNSLKYDFIVGANRNPNEIQLSFTGVNPELTKNGDLRIKTSINEIIEKAPYCYQMIDGKEKMVQSKYLLKNNVLSFSFPNGYNSAYPLIIDPQLIFATYSAGNSGTNYANSATYDDLGNTYAGGLAYGAGWPVSAGAYQTAYTASFSGCINKYSSDGTTLMFSTFIGGTAIGSGKPMPNVMRVDQAGNLYVAGTVSTTQMPVTTGCYQSTMGGSSDIFISKFSSNGSTLLGSTYLGGSSTEGSLMGATNVYAGNTAQNDPINPTNIAFDDQGNVWVTSNSASTDFPVTANASQSTKSGSNDVVVAKLNPNLTVLIYSTFIGGSGWDGGVGIEYNKYNNTVGVVGYTASNNFPTTPGVYHATSQGGVDGFALILDNASYQLTTSTYLGTTAADVATRLAFDCGNNFFIAGRTLGNYPVTNNASQGLVANGYVFVDKLNPTLSSSIASTRTGANNSSIVPAAMMVDLCGNVLVATIINNSFQQGMPLTPDAFQTSPRGFYFAAFKPNFSGLAFGSYFGASTASDHYHPGVARIDPKGFIYQSVCYVGSNGNWPTYPPNVFAPNKLNGGTNDIVTFKFDFQVVSLEADLVSGYGGYDNLAHAVRGCKSAFVKYSRGGDTTIPMILRFNFPMTAPNAAVNGTDYQQVYDSIYFAPYQRVQTLEIKPLLVPNMPTGDKLVVIESLNPCGCDGGLTNVVRRDTVHILDSLRMDMNSPLPAYCPGDVATIIGDVDPGLAFQWTPSEYDTGNLTIKPIMLTTRNYVLKVTQPGAPATCPPNTRTFHALVEQFPKIYATSDTIVCVVDSIPISLMAAPDSVNYTYQWSPGTGLRATDIGTNYFKMPSGTYNYTITVTTPIAQCSSTHNMTINVRPPFKFTSVTPPSGTTVDYLDEVGMSASGAILYTWLPTGNFVDPTLNNPTTLPVTEPGSYFVTGIDQYGCKDTAEIILNVKFPYDPVMPNAFSPNGDGKNDVFSIPNGKFIRIQRFQVYDRWGRQVFSTQDPLKGWDGSDAKTGKPSEQGVYMYIVTIELPNKEIKTYKGDVQLMR